MTIVTLFKFIIFPLEVVNISISLPGVAQTISAPFFISDNYPPMPGPPYTLTVFIFKCFENDLHS